MAKPKLPGKRMKQLKTGCRGELGEVRHRVLGRAEAPEGGKEEKNHGCLNEEKTVFLKEIEVSRSLTCVLERNRFNCQHLQIRRFHTQKNEFMSSFKKSPLGNLNLPLHVTAGYTE